MKSMLTSFYKSRRPSQPISSTEDKETTQMLPDPERNSFPPPKQSNCQRWKLATPWILHFLLIVAYGVMLFKGPNIAILSSRCWKADRQLRVNKHWEARFQGTFLEIGDFFNVSETTELSDGAVAAWESVESLPHHNLRKEEANLIRIDRADVESSEEGDPMVLYKVYRLHCLHILWKRWHNQLNEEEKATAINGEDHDYHCYEIVRYALMCEGNITLKQVGWRETENYSAGMMDIQKYCKDPEADGLEKNLIMGSH